MSGLRKAAVSKKGQRFSRGQRLALAGILAVNLILFGSMWYINRGSGSANSPPPVGGNSLPLEAAYKQALALALEWQPDVQVVGVTASWRLSGGDQLTLGRPAWAFQFYSPARRRIGAVMVDLVDGAQSGRRQSLSVAPYPVAPDWSLGSDELLLTFMSHGGQDFLAYHPGANIHVQLKGDQVHRSVWYVTAVDPVARQSLIVGIDANSREVVFSKSTAGGG